MIAELRNGIKMPVSAGWVMVIVVLVIQAGTLVYAFGKIADRVQQNSIAITSIIHEESNYARLSQRLADMGVQLNKDERLLNSIADKVGARSER